MSKWMIAIIAAFAMLLQGCADAARSMAEIDKLAERK